MSRAFFAFSTALLWHSLFDSIEFNSIELDCIWFDLIHQTVSLISASVKCLVRSVECRKSSRGSINFTILPMPLYLLQLNQSMDLRSRIWWALIFGHVYFYFTQPKKKKKAYKYIHIELIYFVAVDYWFFHQNDVVKRLRYVSDQLLAKPTFSGCFTQILAKNDLYRYQNSVQSKNKITTITPKL